MFGFLRNDKKMEVIEDTVCVSERIEKKLMVHRIVKLISEGKGRLDLEYKNFEIWKETILKFDNFKIVERDKIIDRDYESVWIDIIVFNQEKEFEVYKSPELNYRITNYGEILITLKYANLANVLEVEWNHQGLWCEYITKKVNDLLQEVENSIEEEKKLKKMQELRRIRENKDYFNNVFAR